MEVLRVFDMQNQAETAFSVGGKTFVWQRAKMTIYVYVLYIQSKQNTKIEHREQKKNGENTLDVQTQTISSNGASASAIVMLGYTILHKH